MQINKKLFWYRWMFPYERSPKMIGQYDCAQTEPHHNLSSEVLSGRVVAAIVAQVEQGSFRLQHDGKRLRSVINDTFFFIVVWIE